jgi:hypothetical protein
MRLTGAIIIAGALLMFAGPISAAARDLSRRITAHWLALIVGAGGVILRMATGRRAVAAWRVLRDVATC